MKKIMVVGATSAIAEAFLRCWLADQKGEAVACCLLARREDRLKTIAKNITISVGGHVETHTFNAEDPLTVASAIDSGFESMTDIDLVLVAFGSLPDQPRTEQDPAYAIGQFNLNATATIAAMNQVAARLQERGQGTLVVLGSVAGDRGRASNGLYGAAKASVACFASALRVRLFGSGVHVMEVRPGFTQTPMTAELDLPQRLVSSPDRVANVILKGLKRHRSVVYAPGFWRWIMWVIRWLPEPIFKRLKL